MLDLSERSHCFYWQTDRNLSVEDYESFFLKRHEVSVAELEQTLRNGITVLGEIRELSVLAPDENVLRGNVNIVRKVVINGQEYVVRVHPKGIKNGYFYVEQVALQLAQQKELPVPQILQVHESHNEHDMDFVLMTAAPGITMEAAIQQNPEVESRLLQDAGRLMALLHEIRVVNFGAFNNQVAKSEGKLVGLHATYQDFIHCGLEENLQRLISFGVITETQAERFRDIFRQYHFEPSDDPRLIHNDYADWNLLAHEQSISGILDWDECHGGDPIADLACWSTFYDMVRFTPFLEGYQSQTQLPHDFDLRFHYYRFRYTISKMALRVKRAQVDRSAFLQDKIRIGKEALAQEAEWFENHR